MLLCLGLLLQRFLVATAVKRGLEKCPYPFFPLEITLLSNISWAVTIAELQSLPYCQLDCLFSCEPPDQGSVYAFFSNLLSRQIKAIVHAREHRHKLFLIWMMLLFSPRGSYMVSFLVGLSWDRDYTPQCLMSLTNCTTTVKSYCLTWSCLTTF